MVDASASTSEFRADVLRGLSSPRKSLPCKYFYDDEGARLFDRICELPEYYLTRTELHITRRNAAEITSAFGPRCRLVELGSGNSQKTRLLLDRARGIVQYVPVDISPEYLNPAAERVRADYPAIEVAPVCADYGLPFELPRSPAPFDRTIVYFPGSTVGNLSPSEAAVFLRRMAGMCGLRGGVLVGVDLKKPVALLEAAYNDAAGVTAAFNLNLLTRINRELSADFRLDGFLHHAPYDAAYGRIEMTLVSLAKQVVHIGEDVVAFTSGERITTEHCYKYSLRDFAQLASAAALRVERTWTDERSLFSLQYLVPGAG